jgi:hypothetical protein
MIIAFVFAFKMVFDENFNFFFMFLVCFDVMI